MHIFFLDFVIDRSLINRDEEFWRTKVEPQVPGFIVDSLQLEIIDSRFDKGFLMRTSLLKP